MRSVLKKKKKRTCMARRHEINEINEMKGAIKEFLRLDG